MSERRVLVLVSGVMLFFAVVVCRLYALCSNTAYAAKAAAQSTVTLALPARRGNFYDCEGLPLTGLDETWYALCVPGQASYARLYPLADAAGQATLYQKRSAAAPFLLEVGQDVTALGVRCWPGVQRYATAPLCAHLIGYVDGEGHGAAGLEAALDKELAGTGAHDTVTCEVTARGRLRADTEPVLTHADSGALGVELTISREIQRAAEAVAAETMTSGCIVVLDAATAEVRASVSVPGFDPADVAASLDAANSPLVDRALCAYAVGSVFKPAVAAAALEAGTADLTLECPGYHIVGDTVFRCAGGLAHGTVDLALALQKSCNGYFIALGQATGAEAVRGMASALGFGRTLTVAGGLNAASGTLPEAEALASAGEFANFCFGQGQLLATPLQVAAMMNTFAADGIYREPSFVRRTLREADGETVQAFSAPEGRRVVSSETAATLRTLLAGVVTDGTGREAACATTTAAGKTGTAQTGQFQDGAETKNYWFAGFFPAEAPQYTVVVLQDGQLEPEFSSAAIFARVCEAVLA